MEIKLVIINNSPVFSIPDASPFGSRIYGATHDKKGQRWLFPAFPPFLDNVLQDLEKVYPDMEFEDKAKTHIDSLDDTDTWHDKLKQMKLPVTSYGHQLEGSADLIANYRWILQWEMGTGKTKTVIDAIRILGCKTIVLCPLIALDNWVDEVAFHSGGELTAIAMKGATRKKKIQQIQAFKDHDVLVVTYDTARLYGIPHLFPKTLKVFSDTGRVPGPNLKKCLKRVNDEKEQVRLATAWVNGTPPREVKVQVDALVGDDPQWLGDLPYVMLVADESHRIKRIQSRRTKACLQLSGKAARRVLLSGTLVQGDPRDLYPQLKFLAPYLMKEDWMSFCKTYLITSPRNEHIVTGYRNMHRLNRRLSAVSNEKRLKDCVDLPERRFEVIPFALTPAQRRDYNAAVSEWAIEQPMGEALEIQNGAIRIMKLLQICSGFLYVPENTGVCDTCSRLRLCVVDRTQPGGRNCIKADQVDTTKHVSLKYPDNPKLDALEDKLKDLVISSKVIIWANFQQELDDIERILQKNKWSYVRVDGSTTKHIKKLADRFTNDKTCRVYLAQISTGIAITLNAAEYAIYYSRDWSLENRKQSAGRNLRIGQDKKTVVYDFCANGTVELQQLQALNTKDDISNLLMNKIDCVLCNKYATCQENEVLPWSNGCYLSTTAERVIAKARKL